MNTHDVLKYGHLWVHKHLEGLSEAQMLAPNVCGWWSVKDILAHLASYEILLVEVFRTCIEAGPTPTLDLHNTLNGDAFNAMQVGLRKEKSPAEVLAEYDQAFDQGLRLLPRIPEAQLRQAGTIPWYGMEYSLEDFVVYQYYGHKREHCAQIAAFRDQFK